MHSALVTTRKNLSRNNADEVRVPTSAALRGGGTWNGGGDIGEIENRNPAHRQRKPQFLKGEI